MTSSELVNLVIFFAATLGADGKRDDVSVHLIVLEIRKLKLDKFFLCSRIENLDSLARNSKINLVIGVPVSLILNDGK